MMYEWKGHATPTMGWRYSKETMAKLDAEGRIWYPKEKSKRPRLKRYLDEMPGRLMGTVWTDIFPINSQAQERLGYPTQKPQALLDESSAHRAIPEMSCWIHFADAARRFTLRKNLGGNGSGLILPIS